MSAQKDQVIAALTVLQERVADLEKLDEALDTVRDSITTVQTALNASITDLHQVVSTIQNIDWGVDQGELPVLSLAAPAAVQLDKAKSTIVSSDVNLDKPALNDDDGADWTVVGVASSHFPGGTVPSGKIKLRKGDQKSQAQFTLAPHAGVFFKNKAQVVTSNPVNVQLAPAVDIVVSGGVQPGKNPSGLPWRSGVTMSANDMSMFDQIDWFQQQRGAKIDVLNVKSNGNKGWKELLDAINHKGEIYAECVRRGIVVTQVLDIPDQEPDIINGIIAGKFDSIIHQLGLVLNSYPRLPGYAVRLAHEIPFTPVNGPSKWGVDKFNAAWNNYAAGIRTLVQGVQIEWNLLRNLGQFSLAALYPGDINVDIIGNDPYGNEDLPTDASFAQYRAKFLDPLANMARQRHKKIAFAEWAVTNTIGPNTVRDSAPYIRGMYKFFLDNADIMNHECYFHINDKGSQTGDHNHLLFGPDSVSPKAAAEYARLFGGHA